LVLHTLRARFVEQECRLSLSVYSHWLYFHQWVYRGDDWLLVRRWEYLLAYRHAIDIVQVISWNDYGESHYLAPVRGAQPNSQAWVNGFPHSPWLVLNAYFARAFKEGRLPPIRHDKIFAWARPHPKNATASDTLPRPRNWELVSPPSLHKSLSKRLGCNRQKTSFGWSSLPVLPASPSLHPVMNAHAILPVPQVYQS